MLLEALAGYAAAVTVVVVVCYRERREAQERLYGAWREGAQIPVLPGAAPEPEVEESPFDGLPLEIMDWLSRWEEPPVKLVWARRARATLAKYKGNIPLTIGELDSPTFR